MKKILFIIPFILLLAACGELQTEGSVSIGKQPETGGTTNPGGDGGETTNPGGDGGSTIDPGGDGDGSGSTDPENPTDKPGYDTTFDASKDVFASNLYYGRSLLTQEEQKIYDVFVDSLVKFEVTEENKNNSRICTSLYNNGVNLEYGSHLPILTKIMQNISYDEQRLTYLYSIVPRLEHTNNAGYIFVNGKYYVNQVCFDIKNSVGGLDNAKLGEKKASYEAEMAQVEVGAKQILSKLKSDMTEAQKFRVLHDELIKLVSYGQKDEGTGDIRGGFLYKKLFCEGYARTLSYLCQRAGIECLYIVGTANYDGTGSTGGGAPFDHAWVKVKLDGKWYNVDPTNNDSLDPYSQNVLYNNFLQSDTSFMKNHTEGITTKGQKTSYATIPASDSSDFPFDKTNY